MKPYTVSKPLALLLLFCGLALIVTNVLMARRLSQVRRFSDLLNNQNKLQPGALLPALMGYDREGKKVIYAFNDNTRDTLLLVLSPGCHACDDNWPNWNRLIGKLDAKSIRLIIANATPNLVVTEDYLARHQIKEVPLVAEVMPEIAQSYRMGYTPQTVLIDHTGRVKKVQTGILTDNSFTLVTEMPRQASALAR